MSSQNDNLEDFTLCAVLFKQISTTIEARILKTLEQKIIYVRGIMKNLLMQFKPVYNNKQVMEKATRNTIIYAPNNLSLFTC